MASQKSMYGVVSVLVALLVISSSLAAYYYSEYNQVSISNGKLQSELQSASEKYSVVANQYNSILSSYNGSVASFRNVASIYNETSANFLALSSQFNLTFSLLVSAVSNLNTSDSAYINASTKLSELWSQYLSVTNEFRGVTSSFETALTSFENANNVTLSENISPIPVALLTSDVLIDFGNGTTNWFNDTAVEPGWNMYVTTLVLTGGNVNATWYPEYSEHFMNGIDGVSNSNSPAMDWFLWTYNSTSWQVAQTGADAVMVYNGSIFAWTYCPEDANFNPTCTPP